METTASDSTEHKEKQDDTFENKGHDPFYYTKTKDFTSEVFKIEINNLNTYTGFGQLRKLLNDKLRLNPRKIKAFRTDYAYVTFQNEEDRDKALTCLDGYLWKGKKLSAKKANPTADPMVRKRETGDSEDCVPAKKLRENEDIPVEERLKNAVTPLWNMPYEEQLKVKTSEVNKFLVKLGKEISKVNSDFHQKLIAKRKDREFRCCTAKPISPSPFTSAYRNKCEFSIGRDLMTNKRTVGFRLNRYKEGSMSVMPPDECVNISEAMLKAVKSFEGYVCRSDKEVFNPETHDGYWKQLTVRTSRENDILLIIVMEPQQLSEEEIEEEKVQLKHYFEEGDGRSCNVTSVYFQLVEKKQSGQENTSNIMHLLGKTYLEDTLLGMKFQVSPEAFFQVNPAAAEVLYSIVLNIVKDDPTATALDICCGTGTIGLILAKQGAKVIGIEMCAQAIENARINAKMNDITSVEFLCGKAEEIIFQAIQLCNGTEAIAVANPPRAGLHTKVVKAIRACEQIKKLVYVSCKPSQAMNNFIDLCRPTSNNYKGIPFQPVLAASVDMFPQTPHYELVLVFQRQDCIK